MKITMLILALIFIFFISGSAYLKYRMASITNNNLQLSIDQEISKAMRGGMFPGLVVGVYKNGKSYVKGYGTVNKDISLPPNAETTFQIGSVSKLFTASLLQILCDEGIVSMDDTLGKLIGGLMPLSLSVKEVTLRQLVTHRSGFPLVPKSLLEKATQLAGKDKLMVDPYSHLDSQDIFDYLAAPEGKKEAGRFTYSNYGMGLLAHVLELVTGKSYESLVRDKVFLPNQMNHSAISLTPAMQTKLAQGYTAKGLPTPIWTFTALAGAGAYTSNAEDMMKFIEASISNSEMASQLFLKMSEPQFRGKSGIGWMQSSFIDRFVGNKGVVWHNGMVGGYASYLAIDKESGAGVVLLTNQASSLDMLGMMLMRQARTQSWSLHSPSKKRLN